MTIHNISEEVWPHLLLFHNSTRNLYERAALILETNGLLQLFSKWAFKRYITSRNNSGISIWFTYRYHVNLSNPAPSLIRGFPQINQRDLSDVPAIKLGRDIESIAAVECKCCAVG